MRTSWAQLLLRSIAWFCAAFVLAFVIAYSLGFREVTEPVQRFGAVARRWSQPKAPSAAAANATPCPCVAGAKLKAGQSCMGEFNGQPGSIIVRGEADGVPNFTQLIENGTPVRCVGDHRIESAAAKSGKRF